MALITCPECNGKVSDQATTCIHCGYPLQQVNKNEELGNYKVVLINCGDNKNKVVEVISNIKGINISEVRKYVNKLPYVIKENLPFVDAQKLQRTIASHGAKLNVIDCNAEITNGKIVNKPNTSTPTCPKCGSTAITAGQRGYSVWTGFLGSGKTVNRCANCGYSWTPGK